MTLAFKSCKTLKNLVTIFFFTSYLLSVTEFYQLLKLPVVFQHFKEHKMMNRDLSFMEFLDMHYMHGSPLDADHERDMQLPFKTVSVYILALAPVITPEQPEFTVASKTYIISNEFGNRKDDLIPAETASSIFQPPRA